MLKRPGFNYSQTYIEHGYLELCIPPAKGGGVSQGISQVELNLSIRFFLVQDAPQLSPHLAAWKVHDDCIAKSRPIMDSHFVYAIREL